MLAERFHANVIIVFRFTYYDVRMKNRDRVATNMPDNLISITDIFVDFKDGVMLTA